MENTDRLALRRSISHNYCSKEHFSLLESRQHWPAVPGLDTDRHLSLDLDQRVIPVADFKMEVLALLPKQE